MITGGSGKTKILDDGWTVVTENPFQPSLPSQTVYQLIGSSGEMSSTDILSTAY